MLTKVQISNINAIDYCDIDFQKGKYKYLENMIYQNELVNPIAFYGSNGSGKSSFFEAILSVLKLIILEPQKVSPFRTNRFNIAEEFEKIKENTGAVITDELVDETLDSIKSFVKLFFEISNNKYEYYVETSLQGCITKEYLLVNALLLFDRDVDSYVYNDKKTNIVESLYPTLRKIAIDNHEDEYITTAFDFLSNMGYIDAAKQRCYFKDAVERSNFDIMVEKSTMVKEILSQYQEFPSYNFVSRITDEGKKEYQIQLETDKGYLSMPYQFMSTGMLNQSVLLSVLLSLPKHGVLFIDEIEDALHPITITDFIKVAQQRDIQLIFTSHNTYLLQKLRPDQIIFANWKNGYSTYKKLSDIYPNIREVNNIEKMYFSNMFEEGIKNG